MTAFDAFQVPLEYDLLKEMAPTLLRNRLVLLHHFSDIFCPGIAAFPLGLQVRYIEAAYFVVVPFKSVHPGGQVGKKVLYFFYIPLLVSSCLLGQRCSTAQRHVELSKNILQNHFHSLTHHTVYWCATKVLRTYYRRTTLFPFPRIS